MLITDGTATEHENNIDGARIKTLFEAASNDMCPPLLMSAARSPSAHEIRLVSLESFCYVAMVRQID
jgi:hypothetical protein